MLNAYYLVWQDGAGEHSRGHTLYVASRTAASLGVGANVITPEGRLVAFYCGWRKRIAPGFGAHSYEREELLEPFGDPGPLTRAGGQS